jgi:CheY-like chemotaxis protein
MFKKYRIDEIDMQISRDDLLRRSRILVVDDERPDLIDDLSRAHFSVDYLPDVTKENLDVIERPLYDLIILDFFKVGMTLGADHGLSLLRHIKRVNPTAVILAYTSKALGTEHADFFRMADGVLSKDAGITDSIEKVEEYLRKAHSIQNLWNGMLNITNIQAGSKKDIEWQDLFVRGMRKGKMDTFRQQVMKSLGGEGAKKIGMLILEKMIEHGLKVSFGG